MENFKTKSKSFVAQAVALEGLRFEAAAEEVPKSDQK